MTPGRWPGRLATVRRGAIAIGVAVAVVVLLIPHFTLFPGTSLPARADAVVLLAGDPTTRLPVALRLARQGPGVLAISADGRDPVNASSRTLCGRSGDLTVYCFWPHPADTRGEARAIGRLAAQHGWNRITVVTSNYHVARAALLIRRCTDAQVSMAAARPSLSIAQWCVVVAHEIGGLGLATAKRSC